MTPTSLALRAGSLALLAVVAAACAAGATPAPTSAPSMAADSMAPSMAADSMAPESMAPESMAPESIMPGASMAADSMAPESMAPESMMPAASMAPGASGSVTNDGTGTFHALDGSASGTVTLYHNHSEGTFYVTFEGFKTASATGVHVLLVTGADVMASNDVDPSKALDLGTLPSASGMIDLPLPAGIDPSTAMGYHTVVLWDPAMGHAIAAAPLR